MRSANPLRFGGAFSGTFGFAKPGADAFTQRVQLEFFLNPSPSPAAEVSVLPGGCRVPMIFVRNRRARRYILRLRPDGVARVTVPRGGSAVEARRFVERQRTWLERELQRLFLHSPGPKEWRIGTEVFLRGERLKIEAPGHDAAGHVRLGTEVISTSGSETDLRRLVESHLWGLAANELPPRVAEFAVMHQLPVRRVTVRNQRSRWGSCSRRGVVSLNWRLIQMPPFVSDYIILHELTHLREMNHSPRYWRQVQQVCPNYLAAERWLRAYSGLLSRPS